jgi:Fe-S-cluster-containing hydrogenase component 2
MEKSHICPAAPIITGVEDKFHFEISEACIKCGACVKLCPVHAISMGASHYQVDAAKCIDCGTCSSVCPTGAAHSLEEQRNSIALTGIEWDKCYFNPGCALSVYKPELPPLMLQMLRAHLGDIKFHNLCCHHDPKLPEGSVIINNCAGCDRRFRSLYAGIRTISFWEVIDSFDDLKLPDYHGIKMSVHDSCGYRHKPQVHAAIRSLLRKMNIKVVEAKHHGMTSECCGDNFYGYVPNEEVERRIKRRANEFPCDDVVVYCIGCERAMFSAGKRARYMPDLIFGRKTEVRTDTLDEYHSRVSKYIDEH